MTIGGATFLLIVASLVVAGIALLCLRKVPLVPTHETGLAR
jgi:hypothetical protein